MADQIRISDSGELEVQPVTWDGEPMYSPATVQEGLFSTEAFEQLAGQLALDDDDDYLTPCERRFEEHVRGIEGSR